MNHLLWIFSLLPLLTLASGCVCTSPVGLPAERQPFGKEAVVFYVTGIGGKGRDARHLATGLKAAGYEGEFHVHDWTGTDPPLTALGNGRRQRAQSRRLARRIEQQRRSTPASRFCSSPTAVGRAWPSGRSKRCRRAPK